MLISHAMCNLARSSYQLDSSPTRHPGRSERVSAAAQESASIDASIVSTPPRCSRQAMHQWRCFPMPELPILLAVVIEWRGPGTRLHLSSSPSDLNIASSQRHRQRQLLRHVVQVPCPTCARAHMSDTHKFAHGCHTVSRLLRISVSAYLFRNTFHRTPCARRRRDLRADEWSCLIYHVRQHVCDILSRHDRAVSLYHAVVNVASVVASAEAQRPCNGGDLRPTDDVHCTDAIGMPPR